MNIESKRTLVFRIILICTQWHLLYLFTVKLSALASALSYRGYAQFEGTKTAIRTSKSKDRQYNGLKKWHEKITLVDKTLHSNLTIVTIYAH